jgi:hypothetical protein
MLSTLGRIETAWSFRTVGSTALDRLTCVNYPTAR